MYFYGVALIGEEHKMVVQEFTVDLNKPLVFQVSFSLSIASFSLLIIFTAIVLGNF